MTTNYTVQVKTLSGRSYSIRFDDLDRAELYVETQREMGNAATMTPGA